MSASEMSETLYLMRFLIKIFVYENKHKFIIGWYHILNIHFAFIQMSRQKKMFYIFIISSINSLSVDSSLFESDLIIALKQVDC